MQEDTKQKHKYIFYFEEENFYVLGIYNRKGSFS